MGGGGVHQAARAGHIEALDSHRRFAQCCRVCVDTNDSCAAQWRRTDWPGSVQLTRGMIWPVVFVWNPFTVRVLTVVCITTTTGVAVGLWTWWRKLRRLRTDVIRLERSEIVPHSTCGTKAPSAGLNVIWCATWHGHVQHNHQRCSSAIATDHGTFQTFLGSCAIALVREPCVSRRPVPDTDPGSVIYG